MLSTPLFFAIIYETGGKIKRTKNNSKNLSRGFTLIETIFVIGVLAIILAGTFSLIQGIISLNKKIAMRSAAYQIMDTELEEARSKNFGTSVAKSTTASTLPSGNTVVVTENTNIFGQNQTDIKEVTVTVHWKFKNEQQEVKSSTYVARGGIKK